MAVAPHALAAQSAAGVLREGGNAIEAMVAAAATVAVVYPHMNGIGGDVFWLVHEPGRPPHAIDACGAAAQAATREFYTAQGLQAIPHRGPLAANTVAGAVSGWGLALEISRREWGGRLPFARLLEDAIAYADGGFAVTHSQANTTAAKYAELADQPGFAGRFLPRGQVPPAGARFIQKPMAETLRHIARRGPDDFYRGELAQAIAAELAAAGSPLTRADLAAHRAAVRAPLALRHRLGMLYNVPPPTQGVTSLLILGMLDRLGLERVAPDSADYVHLIVEATKRAFMVRDREVTDPQYMRVDAQALLEDAAIARLARDIDRHKAAPWCAGGPPADTVWLGVIDAHGRAASFIQSLYHEFGSGIVLASTGINWQNRGCSFSLDPNARQALVPGRKPFHTLNPALALFDDGRVMVYGTMGGDGQPQTQAAVYTRYAVYRQSPQQAIAAPRWLLGRTWGQTSDTLKLEARFPESLVTDLRARGHAVEVVAAFDEIVGHAGAVVRHPSGLFEGGFDPRSDGGVAEP